jgi:uncharacterized protein YlxW (UPF0749 family)
MASRFARDAISPATIAEANERLLALADALTSSQPTLNTLLRELATVDLAYRLRYAAVVKTSKAGSEDRRRAEAELAMAEVTLDDSPEDLATRRSVLEMRVKSMREAQHNIRAQISGLQTLSANLRAEAAVTGVRT